MSASLCSTFNHSIDAKGRMSFPTKLREKLGAEFYLCIGHDDHYIAVYSPEEFEVYQAKLRTIPGKLGSDIRRKLIANADRQAPDKQGRIFIAPFLKEHAKLDKDVVVIGQTNRAEIWDKDAWDKKNSSLSMEDIIAATEELSL